MTKHKVWIADIETFANCFTLVAEDLDGDVREFVLHESRNDSDKLLSFLAEKPAFVGFNWLGFDAQVIEEIWQKKMTNPIDIYNFAQSVIEALQEDRFNLPYPELNLSFPCLDLYKIHHYDNNSKRTSLKQLEFFFRLKKIGDLPYDHTTELTEKQVEELVKYNRYDVSVTKMFYEKSKGKIEDRKEAYKEHREPRIMNMSDSSLASFLFAKPIADSLGISTKALKKKRTKRNEINVGECIFDYYQFFSAEAKQVYQDFKNHQIKPQKGEIVLKKQLERDINYYGIPFHYGLGGAHACISKGVYTSDDVYTIVDVDVASYYPNLAIQNGYYPEHLSERFNRVYKGRYLERKKYPKKTHKAKNLALKLQLNCVYGNSNSKYSYFYDPKYTVTTVVNGQLSLLMLADSIYNSLSDVTMLQLNTDGATFKIKRSDLEQFNSVCAQWEQTTKLELEHFYYTKMVISDVNNYLAIYDDGNVKRKGKYCTYEDLVNNGEYHKNASAMVIPKALSDYFVNGVPIRDTIDSENNLHDFLYGVKKTKAFDFRIWKADRLFVSRPEKPITDRIIRYYVAKPLEDMIRGGSLYKHWKDGRVTGLNVGQLIVPMQTCMSERAELRVDLNREHYISEAQKIIDEVTLN